MFERAKTLLKRLFNVTPRISDEEMSMNDIQTMEYLDNFSENITAIVANSLSTLTFGDATLEVTPNSKLQEIVSEVIKNEFVKAKRNIACGLGVGMIASIPYCVDNGLGRKIYVDTITKDRFFITGLQGTDVTQCVALADVKKIGADVYTRWVNYEVNNGMYIITNKCMKNDVEVPMDYVAEWSNIQDEVKINNVDRMPIGIFKCPSGGRRPDDIQGLPITFGCHTTIDKIKKTLDDIEVEFKRKKTKVFADRGLLRVQRDENGNAIKQDFDDDLFIKFGSSDNFTTEVFSPEFRQTAYFDKLNKHFEFLEKQIGVSKGILTELNTNGATATEIRRSTYATFCLVDDIRKSYEKYIKDLAYGVEVLAVAYGMASKSEYDVKIDWSYAMLEDSQESFAQITQAVSLGAERLEELRMFVHPNESYEEASDAIREIKESNPSIKDCIRCLFV